ncbi:Bgt-4193 [Blumeria graminis f. sp. tritici]|uniref:Bgt-4193 n=2 Tax=Blumeria graminis f. sp. tritici TaxID=62690 RepID=A0A061HLM9_BLUGR|nr:hypothetical protein BGT96224_4193 [Blumeria graminis f. sp. tritici 96224]VCU39776.1 Bgt-4193 [Blumeria graminis f. sp. tritici]
MTTKFSYFSLRCTSNIPNPGALALGQIRHASLIKRPYRPYTFTQLITLSDGSSYTVRTTSPAPVYKSTKDSRNHPLWQPSSAALRNVEADEAGRLRAFRMRFGHSWETSQESSKDSVGGNTQGNLMDLIRSTKTSTGEAKEVITEKVAIEEDPGEKMVTARNALGKAVQVKVKDLEQFRKDQKLASGKSGWGS